MAFFIAIVLIGILLLLSSWEDYRGEGFGLRSLCGTVLVLLGSGYLLFGGIAYMISLI